MALLVGAPIAAHAEQGRLGLVVLGLTDDLKQFFGSGKSGVLVGKIEPGSPADKAGVKIGDVIADVDGKPVDDAGDVLSLLSGKKKGDAVALTVMRNKLPMLLTAKMQADVAAMPMPRAMQLPDPFQDFGSVDQRLRDIERRLEQLEHR
ncbi:MAG TPA: PDZ domain-containing protein [Kofleriaceae bacterium]|nr:PDZ domain-containing protein [Kofleriaceae bacterium]